MGFSIENFITMGLYYGYPDCCIVEFTARALRIFAKRAPEAFPAGPWDDSGYLPCRECQAKILSVGIDKFAADVIAPKRCHAQQFPEDDI